MDGRAPGGPRRAISQPPALLPDPANLHTTVIAMAAGYILLLAVAGFYNAQFLPLLMGAGALVCVAVVVLAAPVTSASAWLLLAATTPEMWTSDLLPGAENTVTALVKVAGLGLVVIAVARYGMRADLFNPGFAYVVMFGMGLLHGLWPALSPMDSVRSLIGSAAPFAFSFSRLSHRFCRALITATIWGAPAAVAFGILLAGAGIRPLFVELGGVRLQGSTHPAFLGGFAMFGVYAALVELYRDGKSRRLGEIALNYVILVLSGARAPLAISFGVVVLSFLFLGSEHFPARRRIPWMLAGMLLLPVLFVVASGSGADSIRLFSVLADNARDLSGRDVIWPFFENAWAASPLFGWGVGAGKVVVDPDSLIAHLLGTTAAHNEYLRIGVDGGYFGLALLIGLLALWLFRWTSGAPRTDRFILRLVFAGFAIHSITDNTLIAATASVLFTWVSAVFARAALEREARAALARQRPSGRLNSVSAGAA